MISRSIANSQTTTNIYMTCHVPRCLTIVVVTCLLSWVLPFTPRNKSEGPFAKKRRDANMLMVARCWPMFGPCWPLFRTVGFAFKRMRCRHMSDLNVPIKTSTEHGKNTHLTLHGTLHRRKQHHTTTRPPQHGPPRSSQGPHAHFHCSLTTKTAPEGHVFHKSACQKCYNIECKNEERSVRMFMWFKNMHCPRSKKQGHFQENQRSGSPSMQCLAEAF